MFTPAPTRVVHVRKLRQLGRLRKGKAVATGWGLRVVETVAAEKGGEGGGGDGGGDGTGGGEGARSTLSEVDQRPTFVSSTV